MSDDWGISIKNFGLNGDCPKTNRYEYQWNLSNSKYFNVCQILQSNMHILNIDLQWCSLNNEPYPTGELLYRMLQVFNDRSGIKNDIWYMPVSSFHGQIPDEKHAWFLQ